jgi:hypothetical protein
MIKDEQIRIKFELQVYPHGKLLVGSLAYPTGMTVGTTFDLGKLVIPQSCGLYPDLWFPLDRHRSTIKLKNELMSSTILDGDQEKIILPDWVLLCCFRSAWEQIHYQNSVKQSV